MANQVLLAFCLIATICVVQVASECKDKNPNCSSFGQNGCLNFKAFSVENCQKYCNYCDEAPCLVNGKLREGCKQSTVEGCSDRPGVDCKIYGQNGCKGAYKPWAEKNCKKFCNFC